MVYGAGGGVAIDADDLPLNRQDENLAGLSQAGLMDIRANWINENSWSVAGRKPVI